VADRVCATLASPDSLFLLLFPPIFFPAFYLMPASCIAHREPASPMLVSSASCLGVFLVSTRTIEITLMQSAAGEPIKPLLYD